jgi:hypothetical protein
MLLLFILLCLALTHTRLSQVYVLLLTVLGPERRDRAMEDTDGLEEVTGAQDPEKGVHDLDRVDSTTGSDEKGKQHALEQAPNTENAHA